MATTLTIATLHQLLDKQTGKFASAEMQLQKYLHGSGICRGFRISKSSRRFLPDRDQLKKT